LDVSIGSYTRCGIIEARGKSRREATPPALRGGGRRAGGILLAGKEDKKKKGSDDGKVCAVIKSIREAGMEFFQPVRHGLGRRKALMINDRRERRQLMKLSQ